MCGKGSNLQAVNVHSVRSVGCSESLNEVDEKNECNQVERNHRFSLMSVIPNRIQNWKTLWVRHRLAKRMCEYWANKRGSVVVTVCQLLLVIGFSLCAGCKFERLRNEPDWLGCWNGVKNWWGSLEFVQLVSFSRTLFQRECGIEVDAVLVQPVSLFFEWRWIF